MKTSPLSTARSFTFRECERLGLGPGRGDLAVSSFPRRSEETEKTVTRILVPLDGSSRNLNLLRYASFVAGEFGAQLILLHFYESAMYAPAHMSPRGFDEFRHKMHDQAVEKLKEIQAQLPALAPVAAAELVAMSGFVEDRLAAAVRHLGADLIIMSTHGRTGLRRTFTPSRAVNAVRHTPCPVLVVPQP